MNIPLRIRNGPFGLHQIDFRESLKAVDVADLRVRCVPAMEISNGYWVVLRVVHSESCVDAFCCADTPEERAQAVLWLRDMATVLKSGGGE